MIALRYKPLASGRYSLYLDCYNEATKERSYEFLKLYTTHDYSKNIKVLAKDKPIIEQAMDVLKQRISELFPEYENQNANNTIVDFINSLQERDKNIYKSIIKHLTGFDGNNPKPLHNITIDWVLGLEDYLSNRLKETTVDLLMAITRRYFERAKHQGLIAKNPFDSYKLKLRKNDKLVFLDKTEIEALKEISLTFNPQIADAFFLSLETGLPWKHVKNLHQDQLQLDESKGTVGIALNYQSTTDTYTLVFNRAASRILRKYDGTGLVFDKLPNKANCNIKLHLWGAMAGLNKTLCFSMARNTFIINCFKPDKLLKDVMAESGIKRHSTLKIYKETYLNNGNITV